jgi:hypothetical protein
MTRMEKAEAGLIVALVAAAWAATPQLHWMPAVGSLIGYAAALLLGQGLIRDVARLLVRRVSSGQRQRIVCLCAESSIGIALLVVGASLTFLGLTEPVLVSRLGLSAGIAGVLVLGFVAKDFVITVRREKDHARIIPW